MESASLGLGRNWPYSLNSMKYGNAHKSTATIISNDRVSAFCVYLGIRQVQACLYSLSEIINQGDTCKRINERRMHLQRITEFHGGP
jgi:hypothetical protein